MLIFHNGKMNKKSGYNFFRLILLSLTFVFFSCASMPSSLIQRTDLFLESAAGTLVWEELSPGISYALLEEKNIPQRIHLVKVELSNPGVELFLYPKDAGEPFVAKSAEAYAKENNLIVCMNAAPFVIPSFGKRKTVGIHVSGGLLTSPFSEKYACMGFGKTSSPSGEHWYGKIFSSQKEALTSGCSEILGAFFVILQNGEEVPFARESLDSRSAAGLTQDGETLYLLCAEGESSASGRGVSFQQCARLFKNLGCDSALEFDGGATAALFAGKNVMEWGPRQKAASVFGFCSR